MCVLLSRIRLFVTPWTVAHQASLSMEFCRQEYWSGLPIPPPAALPDPGIEPRSPVLQADSLPFEPPGKPIILSSTMCKLSYLKSGVSVTPAGVSSTHRIIQLWPSLCRHVIARPFSDSIPFLQNSQSCTTALFPLGICWLGLKVWNRKKTSILPRARACLSEPIWILLHLANLMQSHPKISFRKLIFIKRWLSFPLQVSASMHCSADAKSSFSEGLSLLHSISCIQIHIISVSSQDSFPSKDIVSADAKAVWQGGGPGADEGGRWPGQIHSSEHTPESLLLILRARGQRKLRSFWERHCTSHEPQLSFMVAVVMSTTREPY